MLQKLLKFSLNNSALILFAALAVVVATLLSLPRIPVDVFPELNAPRVLVMTEAAGYSAEEVEQYITFPVESAVNGLNGVQRVRSASSDSLSLVWVEFDWGEDIYRARQLVSERLDIARDELPEDVTAEISPITSVTGEIMLISLSSPDQSVSDLDLRAMAEFNLRNKLLAISGVAQVVAIGGQLPEYQVNVSQEQLRLYNLSLEEVTNAVNQAHSTDSAGFLPDVQGLEISIRQSARIQSVEDIRNTVIRYENGSALTVGQVAEVKLGAALSRGTATDNAQRAVVVSIQKSPDTNTLRLTAEVDRVLDSYEKSMPEGVKLNRHVFRQTDFINTAVENVIITLRDAAILVAIILILFLMNVRTTVITLTALPLSLGIALLILWALGLNINVMTLGGLAVSIGELVDDAIIDVENCFRRLKENWAKPESERDSFLWIVYDSSNEIRSSVVFATIIIAVVFLPLLFLQGLEGRFFRPLGLSYIIAILASLLVALTVTPVLCKYLMRNKITKTGDESDSWLVRKLKACYAPLLELSLRYKKTLMAGALVCIVLSLAVASTFGTSFLPKFREGTFTVFVMIPPGSSLAESDRLASGIEKRFLNVEGVRHVVRRSGRAERDEHAELVSTSEIEVSIKNGYDQNVVKEEINDIVKSIPGLVTLIGQPIEHRLSMVLSGTKADVAINLYGTDLAVLRKAAKETVAAVESVPGSTEVSANREVTVQTISVRYRSEDLRRWGITRQSAAEQVSTAFNGRQVRVINDGIKRYDLVVRLENDERRDIDDLRQFMVKGPGNVLVRLTEIADVGPEEAPNIINRDNAQRKAVVSANVAPGYNLGHLVKAITETVQPIASKYGLTVTFGGQFEAQQSATRMLAIMTLAVLTIIFLLLNSAVGSMKIAGLIMINLPLAIIGGVVAVFIADSPDVWGNFMALLGFGDQRYQAPVLSIASIVGYITLFGIAVRNGLLLVNNYTQLLNSGLPMKEAIIKGSLDRLVPIMMTALITILGLLPILMAADKPGGELLAPIAVVQLGGLTTSTFLNLFVIPAGFAWLFRGGRLHKKEVEKIVD
jgi:CzcA family heavy metal efflux pump